MNYETWITVIRNSGLKFVCMILLNFQIFTLVGKTHSTFFVHSDLKCPFIKFSINRYFVFIKKEWIDTNIFQNQLLKISFLCFSQSVKVLYRFKWLSLSISIINNFYCVINCLNINLVKIYRAKFLSIIILKVLPTSYFCCSSEGKNTKFQKNLV